MTILLYIIKMTLISGMLYGYYWFFLRNKRFHLYNRFFLLGIVVVAAVLPLLNIPVPFSGFGNNHDSIRLLSMTTGGWEDAVTVTAHKSFFRLSLDWPYWGVFLYIAGAIFLLISLLTSLIYIGKITRVYPCERIEDIHFFQTNEPGTPFSFFRRVFWNSKLDIESSEGQQILRHELYHVRQQHSVDILFLESITILTWFNPFIYFIKKEIKAIHEFLADEYAISDSNRYAYAELLVAHAIRNKQAHILNPFFHKQIKRRISMLTKFQTSRNNYLSRILILPLLLVLFCAFATTAGHRKPVAVEKTITVVIDAGHGGIDPGAQSGTGVSEKDIALQISKKIQRLAKDYHVQVVMTREKDELPGRATNYRDGLKYRTDLAVESKANLFVSIHVNGDDKDPSKNGFQLYIPDNDATLLQRDLQLGSILTEELKKDYAVADQLIKINHGVAVLTHSAIPAIIVECGYLTNNGDLSFISNEQNQEKIARDILEGIVRFQNESGYSKQQENGSKRLSLSADPLTQSLSYYLIKHVAYPKTNLEKNLEGRVYAKLTLDQHGAYKDLSFVPSIPEAAQVVSINAIALNVSGTGESATQSTVDFKQAEMVPFQDEVKQAVSDYKYDGEPGYEKIVYLNISFSIEKNNNISKSASSSFSAANTDLQDGSSQYASKKKIGLYRAVGDHSQHLNTNADTVPHAKTGSEIFTKVEIEAEYPGGQGAWQNYLSKNLRYPDSAINHEIQGDVVVQFIVDKEGRVSDIKAVSGPEELRGESVRVIGASGGWIPAIDHGEKVVCYKKQPIRYRLERK